MNASNAPSASSPEQARPDVSQYADYRALLQACFTFKSAGRRGFSWRRFSSLAGVKSPNYFQTIVQGKKNLSEPLARVAAGLLGLDAVEVEYFVCLVREAHAPSEDERKEARRTKLRLLAELSIARAGVAQRRLLDAWYHTVVRELTCLPDFDPSPEAVSSRLGGLISPAEAEDSLRLLQDAGLLQVDPGGRLTPAQPALLVPRENDRAKARAFLTQNLAVWARTFAACDPESSFGTVASFAIPEEKMPELIAMARAFSKELAGVQMQSGTPSRVVQMGVFLVPVAGPQAASRTKGNDDTGPSEERPSARSTSSRPSS